MARMSNVIASTAMLKSVGQLCVTLAIFAFVLVLCWFTTRWIAGYQKSQFRNSNLRVVETLRLATNKYIQIIKAGDVYLVIAVGKDHIEKLAELTPEQLKDVGENTDIDKGASAESFSEILNRVRQHLPKK